MTCFETVKSKKRTLTKSFGGTYSDNMSIDKEKILGSMIQLDISLVRVLTKKRRDSQRMFPRGI